MKKLLILVILLVGLASKTSTAPTAPPAPPTPSAPPTPPAPICDGIMSDGGLTASFAQSVAHRLHSLTLEDLRYYFQPDATENNNIPTVNFNMSSDERVLPNAPLYGYDTSFTTMGMRHLDEVLRNMDRNEFGIKNYSIVEQVAHAMHMAELWNRAKKHYDALALLPPSSEVCGCVRDTQNNGVIQELHLMALKIKYPGLTSGRSDIDYSQVGAAPEPLGAAFAKYDGDIAAYDIYAYEGAAPEPQGAAFANYDGDIAAAPEPLGAAFAKYDGDLAAYEISGSYSLKTNRAESAKFHRSLKVFDFSGDEADVVARVSEGLVDGDTGLSNHVDSEEGWAAWREGFKAMKEQDNYQFAVFMFCVLNE